MPNNTTKEKNNTKQLTQNEIHELSHKRYEQNKSNAAIEIKDLIIDFGDSVAVDNVSFRIEKGELFIMGMHINPYEKGNIFNKDPLRVRKLLMHKKEILKLDAKLNEKGLTIVPLKVYLKGSLVKVEIGLAKGKKNYDKRETLAKKTQQREIEKAMKRSIR